VSTPENPPQSAGGPSEFDSLTADLVVLEGGEDTRGRPLPPGLKAAHDAYRAMLANPALRFRPDTPGESPPAAPT
jgi:hypothetical protein